ncbi:MAG: acetyltransferase [Gammaproteobacteria bacterium CG22_combo_CG10-13_8_21_14_all_40_8]|nr:MAG: acetyltransferase [Gammaproteobacteria bacterium CG22_combo_CG10-13_8_21_14_all_40_8]
MSLYRKLAYFLYIAFFRFTPEDYRPYSLGFHRIRRLLVKQFVVNCGDNIRVKYNADISPNIRIGNHSELGQNCLIHANVSIGDYVIMGPDVKIYTRNHKFDDCHQYIQQQGKSRKETRIMNDVWIGANVIILPGIIVEDHAVIGAGAVVTKNVPAWAVVVGNPAKVIKYRHAEKI